MKTTKTTVDKLKRDILNEPFQFDYSYIEKFNQWFTEKFEYDKLLEKLKNNSAFNNQLEELKARKKIAIEQIERRDEYKNQSDHFDHFENQFEKLIAEYL